MNNLDNILDIQENELQNPELHLASQGKRFANYLIDRIGVYIIVFMIIPILDNGLMDLDADLSALGGLLIIFAVLGYWTFFEYFLGKTPAKFITQTKVVTKEGYRISFATAVGRTLCRFIPFDALSFLFSSVGWHDSISRTRVVNDTYVNREEM